MYMQFINTQSVMQPRYSAHKSTHRRTMHTQECCLVHMYRCTGTQCGVRSAVEHRWATTSQPRVKQHMEAGKVAGRERKRAREITVIGPRGSNRAIGLLFTMVVSNYESRDKKKNENIKEILDIYLAMQLACQTEQQQLDRQKGGGKEGGRGRHQERERERERRKGVPQAHVCTLNTRPQQKSHKCKTGLAEAVGRLPHKPVL